MLFFMRLSKLRVSSDQRPLPAMNKQTNPVSMAKSVRASASIGQKPDKDQSGLCVSTGSSQAEHGSVLRRS